MKYHKQFKNINKKSIILIRKLIKKGFFKSNDDVKKEMLKTTIKDLCKIYNLKNIPKISYVENYLNIGSYNILRNEIILNKPSLITFLHEFSHFKFNQKRELNNEKKARGFSISLYYKATPKLCLKAIEKKKIMFCN